MTSNDRPRRNPGEHLGAAGGRQRLDGTGGAGDRGAGLEFERGEAAAGGEEGVRVFGPPGIEGLPIEPSDDPEGASA